jgi:hypothetical protein
LSFVFVSLLIPAYECAFQGRIPLIGNISMAASSSAKSAAKSPVRSQSPAPKSSSSPSPRSKSPSTSRSSTPPRSPGLTHQAQAQRIQVLLEQWFAAAAEPTAASLRAKWTEFYQVKHQRPDIKDSKTNRTALEIAATKGYVAHTRFLLHECGATIPKTLPFALVVRGHVAALMELLSVHGSRAVDLKTTDEVTHYFFVYLH